MFIASFYLTRGSDIKRCELSGLQLDLVCLHDTVWQDDADRLEKSDSVIRKGNREWRVVPSAASRLALPRTERPSWVESL